MITGHLYFIQRQIRLIFYLMLKKHFNFFILLHQSGIILIFSKKVVISKVKIQLNYQLI